MKALLVGMVLIAGISLHAQAVLSPIHVVNPTIIVEFSRGYVRSCCARPEVLVRLSLVQDELEEMGLGLKIYEAYTKPCEQSCIETSDGCMIELPEECTRHARGTSVDVTLVTSSGEELEMPCAFDDFCQKAHRSYMDLPQHVLANRQLLTDVMTKHGFIGSENAWWHFDIFNWQYYPIIDEDDTNDHNQ